MKKYKFDNYYLVNILLFAIYSIIIFFIIHINSKTWVYYIFTFLTFGINMLIYYKIKKRNNTSEKFNNISLLIISYLYIILQITFSILSMILDTENTNIFVIIQIILFMLYIIITLVLNKSVDYISESNKSKNNEVFSIKKMQMKLELYVEDIKDDDFRKEIENLIDKIKYMDPVATNGEIINIDKKIDNKIDELIKIQNIEEKKLSVNKIKKLINERNEKSKLGKYN